MALLGSVQFGFQIAVMNTSLDAVEDTLHIPASRGAIAVSLLLVGALFGSLCAGVVADRLGPKKATVLNTLPLAVGSILCASAPSEAVFLLGRLLAGIGTGAASLFVPRYLTEIAPNSIRGLLGTLNQLFINVGIVTAFAFGWPYEENPHRVTVVVVGISVEWWRLMFAVGALPAVLQAVGMALCPETPVWLLWAGLHLQASASFRALHGADHTTSTQFQEGSDAAAVTAAAAAVTAAAAEDDDIDDMEQPLLSSAAASTASPQTVLVNTLQRTTATTTENTTESTTTSAFQLLFHPRYRKIMLLAAGLPLLQQFSGINSVILYGSEVFRTAGVKSPILANLLMGCINTAATGVAALLMDRAGRKALLTWSFAGMAASLTVMAAFLMLPTPEELAAQVALTSIFVYIIFFALGCGPVPWVYLPEVLPPAIKGPAQALCTALNWGGNLVIGAGFPAMLRVLGLGGSYAVFAMACCGAALFCARWMVETKQRSLAAVHAELMQ